MIGDWVYGFIKRALKQGQGSESGIIKRSDFEKGKYHKDEKMLKQNWR